jgi:GT2 family glycosyltransferase
MPGITVIIPNWNGCSLTETLLDRLRNQSCTAAEVIVVDNGSTDNSVEMARSRGARVVEMGTNTGFSVAVNRGIEESRTEWVAILNNDVEPARDWLERLAKAVGQPRVWFATGKLLNPAHPEALDGTYDVLCRGACAWRAGQGRPDGPMWARTKRIRFAPFTAALFRKELFEKVGLLDERFESYLEDIDFCLRCAVRGYYGLYVPGAVAYHAGSATLGRWHKDTVRRISRNQVLLVAKHYPPRYLLRYGWSIFVAQTLWGFVAFRHGRGFSFLRGKVEGLWMLRRMRRGAAWKAVPRRLSRVLEESESDMFRLQRGAGFDRYWRLYFVLTSLT